MSVNGEVYTLTKEMVSINKVTKKVSGHSFVPSVIEPSFGIGRILYCVFEHAFYQRKDDKQKAVFAFSPLVAPIQTTVFPLLQRADLTAVASDISTSLRKAGLSNIIDTTGMTLARDYKRFAKKQRSHSAFLVLLDVPAGVSMFVCTTAVTRIVGTPDKLAMTQYAISMFICLHTPSSSCKL